MIYTLTLNPSIDLALGVNQWEQRGVFRGQTLTLAPGGKGINVSRLASDLGGENRAYTLVGGPTGDLFLKLAKRLRISIHAMKIRGSTRMNVTVQNRSLRSSAHWVMPGPEVPAYIIRKLERHVCSAPRPFVWVLSGSLPVGVGQNYYGKLVTRLKAKGVPCAVDANGRALSHALKAKPAYIKCNLSEIESAAECRLNRMNVLKKFMTKQVQSGIQNMIVTLGRRGALFAGTKIKPLWITVPKVRTYRDVGAGDALLASYLVALRRGSDALQAARYSVAASVAYVSNPHNGRLNTRGIQRALRRLHCEEI